MKTLGILLCAGVLAGQVQAEDAPAPVTVLKAARMFDAAAGRIVSPGLVVVQGDTILAAGKIVKQ